MHTTKLRIEQNLNREWKFIHGYIEIITIGNGVYKGKEINLPPLPAPYRYISEQNQGTDLAVNRPCKVSSEKEGFLRCYVNDETDETYWLAEEGDDSPWWQIDLENIYQIRRVNIELAGLLQDSQLVLEISEDIFALFNGQNRH